MMTDKQQTEAREILAEIVAMEPLREASGFWLKCGLCWSSWHGSRQETHAPGCVKRRAVALLASLEQAADGGE